LAPSEPTTVALSVADIRKNVKKVAGRVKISARPPPPKKSGDESYIREA
jgi:hypothetical protein